MSYSSVVLSDNPVAYYHMDEASGQIQDSSGNSNHSTSNEGAGSATYAQIGAITSETVNKSIRFNPSYNFVVPDHATLDVGDIFTVECWLKINALPGTFSDFITKQDGAPELRLYPDGKIHLVKSATSDTVTSTSAVPLDGRFHHFVATKNGSAVKLYLDTIDVTGAIDLSTYVNNALSLKIGASAVDAFNGWLDEIALYNTALSETRIIAHYRAGFNKYVSEVLADSPVAYYRMNEASGQPQDSSGNANHTTTSNGTPVYNQAGAITSDVIGNRAILFDKNSNEWFKAPDHATLDVGDTFTLEAWIKRNSIGAVEHAIISKGQDAGGDSGPQLTINNNTIQLSQEDIWLLGTSNVSITDTINFHHIVATKNGATIKLYLDAIDVTGTTNNNTVVNNTQTLGIGVIPDATGGDVSYFDGWIQEVALYPTALTLERIRVHYEAAIAHKGLDNFPVGTLGKGAGW